MLYISLRGSGDGRGRWLGLAFLCAAALTAAGSVLAAAPQVEDRAGFFQPAAIEEANRIIRQIYAETGPPPKDVLVETLETLPAGKDVKQVAEAEFAARKSNGILILLVKRPGKLWVTVGKETRRGFTAADTDDLVNRIMLPRLKERKADQALLDGLRFVQRKFQVFRATAPTPGRSEAVPVPPPGLPAPTPPAQATEGLSGFGWWKVLALIIGAWIVIGIFRAMSRRPSYEPSQATGAGPGMAPAQGPPPGSGQAPGPGYGSYEPGSGGGWGKAILGGLLGAFVGNWLANTLFRGPSGFAGLGGGGGAYADDQMRPMAPADEGRIGGGGGGDWGDETSSAGAGGDFGGDGGDDFGDLGGGGDFGGGDQ